MKIPGTVSIVTGGASGLGESTVRDLAQQGSKVMIADLNDDRGKEIVEELTKKGFQVQFFKTDVTNEENIQALIAQTVKQFGAIHIVVNCAGIAHAGLLVNKKGECLATSALNRVMAINVTGTFNVSKYAAKQMMSQEPLNEYKERGVIVNVASIAGIEGQTGQTIYGASKGAVIALTLPMARDLGKSGIRVVTIAPGLIETPMGGAIPEKVRLALERATAVGRNGRPEEFASCVNMCVQNSYLTGETIRLDGGIRFPHF